jgi:hypothetical protein
MATKVAFFDRCMLLAKPAKKTEPLAMALFKDELYVAEYKNEPQKSGG